MWFLKIGNHKNTKYHIEDWTLPNIWDEFSSKIIERFDCLIIDQGSESWLPGKTTSKNFVKFNDEDYTEYYTNMFINLKKVMNKNFYWIFDYRRDYNNFVDFLFDLKIYPLFFLRLNPKDTPVHSQDSDFFVILTNETNSNIPPSINETYIYKYKVNERTYLNNPTLFVPYEKNIDPVFKKCIVDAYPNIHDNRELVKIILSSNWICERCTFENTGGVDCEICGGKKDGAKSKKRSRSKRSIKKRSRSKRSVRKRRSKRSVKKRRSNKIKKI